MYRVACALAQQEYFACCLRWRYGAVTVMMPKSIWNLLFLFEIFSFYIESHHDLFTCQSNAYSIYKKYY